jgi:hypothetical protein
LTLSPRRALCAAVFAAVSLGASDAYGATLTNSGGTLTFTGTAADNVVDFDQAGAGTINVDRSASDGDPIAATGCTENTPGESYTCNGVTRLVANGGAGDDDLDAEDLEDIPATLTGAEGNDSLSGGDAADTIDGGAASDFLDGNEADDTLNGGDGDDFFFDGAGNDRVRGDGGGDRFFGDLGNDDIVGGTGYDTMTALSQDTPAAGLSITLDDAANDRTSSASGETDNVHGDVEAVETEFFLGGGMSGADTLVGNAQANSLSSGAENDTVDGGTGNDVINSGGGDDTVRARDGFKDFVNCGEGNDTAEVDTLDDVQECETVNRADVGNANDVPEDRPPTVELVSPGPGALLRTAGPTVVTANASDDRGIAQVLFVDDDRIVCADTTAPYECAYQPRGEDVGRNTLVAVAIDTAQQTASTTRAFNVDRFTVPGITGSVTPARDRRAPFTFRTTGRLRLPAFVTPALGCADGQVSIQVKAGAKTISTRRADLRPDCSFVSTVRFADRRRFTRNGRLRFTLRFTGNEVLNRSAAVARNIRTR